MLDCLDYEKVEIAKDIILRDSKVEVKYSELLIKAD